MLGPVSYCSCGTLRWQWVVLYKHLARQVLDIYLLQKQWRFAGMRQQDVRPMSISMHGDKQADSIVGGSALVAFLFLFPIPSPRLIFSASARWQVQSCDTCGVYLSQDKKAIGPAIRPNMEALFVLLSPVQGGSWSEKLSPSSAHMTYQILSCSFFSFQVSLLLFFFFSKQIREDKEAYSGQWEPGWRSSN